jgi:hypothetical protein
MHDWRPVRQMRSAPRIDIARAPEHDAFVTGDVKRFWKLAALAQPEKRSLAQTGSLEYLLDAQKIDGHGNLALHWYGEMVDAGATSCVSA